MIGKQSIIMKGFVKLASNNIHVLRGTLSHFRRSISVAPYEFTENGSAYEEAFKQSITDPDAFWAQASECVSWFKKWNKVLDDSDSPFTKWFPGGELNTCYNAVDRHVIERGVGDQLAIIHDSPVTNSISTLTYAELLDQVSRFAGALSARGVQKGDRVLIYMPMIPEAVVTMLACARLGAVHSLVFGGFAAPELAVRINHCAPTVVVTASCGIERDRIIEYKPILEKAIGLSEFKPKWCIVYNRPTCQAELVSGRDVDWVDAMAGAKPHDCVPTESMDPLYILYTSGTTGAPKGCVRPCGGHAVALTWSMTNLYGMHPGETWWASSDLGWVVGHSYICYAPLMHGNPTVVFEGKPVGTPDASALFRVIADHDVKSLFVAPTALRAVRAADSRGSLGAPFRERFKCFKYMYVAGEHCVPKTREWAEQVFGVPVLDNWWQTETGWAITASCVGLGNSTNPPMGSAGKAVPGYDVRIMKRPHMDETLHENIEEADVGELGQIVVKLPLPPGTFSTLWRNKEKFQSKYFQSFPGYYDTQDAGFKEANSYVHVEARVDDIINVAGHRISSGAIEEALMQHEAVVKCCVVPVPDSLKGHVPMGLCITADDIDFEREGLSRELCGMVRSKIGPVACFKKVIYVKRLPKTRSGKIPRHTISNLAANKIVKVPPTIDDVSVYPEIRQALQEEGYALKSTQVF